MFLRKLLLAFSFLTSSISVLHHETNTSTSRKCLSDIIEQYFATNSTISIFTTDLQRDSKILTEVYLTEKHAKRNFEFGKFKTIFFDGYNKHCIVVAENIEEFINNKQIFEKLSLWNARAKFIFYVSVTNENLLQVFIDILWFFYIINLIIIMPATTNSNLLNIYSYFPYSTCNNTIPQLIDTYQEANFTFNTNLFPQKVPMNLQKYPVKIHTLIYAPNVLPPNDGIIKNWIPLNITDGVEVKLLEAISRAANFTALFYSATDANWGLVTPDGNATGAIKIIKDRVQDITIGSYSPMLERRMYCDYSVGHLHDMLTWCVPQAKEISRWKNLFFTFNFNTWCSMLVVYIFVAFVTYLMSNCTPKEESSFKTAKNCFIFVFATFLGSTATDRPKKASIRISFLVWLFFGLHFVAAYQAKLISVLLKPSFEKQISSVDEMLASGIEYVIHPTAKRLFTKGNDVRFPQNPDDIALCSDEDVCMHQIAAGTNQALMTFKAHAELETMKYKSASGESKFYFIHYFGNLLEWYMTKGFPLRDRINKYIYRLKSTGLIFKWTEDIKRLHFLKYRKNLEKVKAKEQILTMSHMQGVFFVLILGHCFALVVFVAELFTYLCFIKK